jgi:pyridoxal phosphate enzyme (YggS family)
MPDAMSTIAEGAIRSNLDRIKAAVEQAAKASGRGAAEVTIVGVTKAVGVAEARALLDCGVHDLGENRPEQLASRAAEPSLRAARWHLIGTYQRRKVRDTLALIALVHAVDSIALARSLASRAAELGRTVDCLLQVNVSGEASKHGFAPEAVRQAFEAVRSLPSLRWRGLMTMAPEDATSDACRRIFSATRDLRDRLREPGMPLPDLSMGMSRDYVEAVLEGATLIRVGTGLFKVASGQVGS